jgi:hypothetical protein
MSNNELTFPVKKSDGTTVRMTMEELDNLKKGVPKEDDVIKNEMKPEVIESDSAEATSDKDEIPTEVEEELPVLEFEKSQEKDKDKLSLSELDKSIRDLAKTRKEEELKNSIDFNQVPIEDLSTLSKPEALPITEIPVAPQAEEVQQRGVEWEKEDNKSLLDEPLDKSLPVPVEEGDQAITEVGAPKFDFPEEAKHKEVDVSKDKPKNLTGEDVEDKITDKISEFKKPVESLPRISLVDTEKPVVQDVKIPEEIQIVGPVGELANFSLTDFRRLGSNLDTAVKSLKNKFDNLDKDSYLEFMKGKDAWFGSPIYREYQDTISMALAKNMKISEIRSSGDKDGLSPEELKAILSINDYLD